MCKYKMYKELCELYTDHYGDCGKHICLIDLLGEELLIEKCEWVGLDKQFENEYNEIRDRINKNKESE